MRVAILRTVMRSIARYNTDYEQYDRLTPWLIISSYIRDTTYTANVTNLAFVAELHRNHSSNYRLHNRGSLKESTHGISSFRNNLISAILLGKIIIHDIEDCFSRVTKYFDKRGKIFFRNIQR